MKLVLGDITKMATDAIANAAAADLRPCEGICQAIYNAADTKVLKAACKKIGHCCIGHAVVTPSCGLPCKYIIHVVGPEWYSGYSNDLQLFEECYQNALLEAFTYHCKTVALPLMFSGSLHIPRIEALTLAAKVIHQFEKNFPNMEIYLVVYKKSIYDLALQVLPPEFLS